MARAIRPTSRVVVPVFHEGTLVGFSANTAHHVDIGAATPGLIIDIPDVFAEGMLFAGTKLYERGKRNEAVWELYRSQQPRRAPVAGRSGCADRVRAARRKEVRRVDGPLRAGARARRDAAADGLYRARAAPAHRRHSRRRIPRRRLSRRRRQEPRRAAADQGVRARQGRRHRSRSHRLVQTGRDRVQCAVRGLDQGRLLLRHPLVAARRGDIGRESPVEPGLVPAGESHGAQGFDL